LFYPGPDYSGTKHPALNGITGSAFRAGYNSGFNRETWRGLKMDFKTIREFHWLTKTVIVLTGLDLGLLLIALVVAFIRPDDSAASTGFGRLLLSLGSLLFPAFVVIFVIILIIMAATWMKKYLDQMPRKTECRTEG
jgi:hypothetical protein